jgi:hypothetical protein
VAGWTALAMGIGSAALFSFATRQKTQIPTLLYPYMAAASVFFATCVWILVLVARDFTGDRRKPNAWTWSGSVFVISFVLLLWLGLAGSPGENAVRNINWYLFGTPTGSLDKQISVPELLTMWFNYIAAIGNASALATFVCLSIACSHCSDAAEGATSAAEVGFAGRNLLRLMTLASALMVTSTLTIYLLFGTADQIQTIRAKASAKPSPALAITTASGAVVKLPIVCGDTTGGASTVECNLATSFAESQKKPSSSAAYMALVVGLSFTGALFMIFFSNSAAIDDAYFRLMEEAQTRASVKRRRAVEKFSMKAWKEENGLQDESATDKVLKALALLAPAMTGALTLVVGT